HALAPLQGVAGRPIRPGDRQAAARSLRGRMLEPAQSFNQPREHVRTPPVPSPRCTTRGPMGLAGPAGFGPSHPEWVAAGARRLVMIRTPVTLHRPPVAR